VINTKKSDQNLLLSSEIKSFEKQFNSVIVDNVIDDTRQTIIITTEDKLKLYLQGHLSKVEKSRNWMVPFSLLISLIVSLISSNFKNYIFSKETWSSIFIISTIMCFVWLLFALKNAFKKNSVEMLIAEIKSSTQSVPRRKEV